MKMLKYGLLLLSLWGLSLVVAYPSQLNYNVGDQLAYNLAGTLDARGSLVSTGERTSGSYSTMNSVLVTQCQQEDDVSYLFVMNMFNTEVNVGQGSTDSFTLDKRADIFPRQDDDDDDCPNCLGYDMYYQQMKTGEIVQIWYNQDDSPYFVNVKVGAINSFQTHVVAANQQMTTVENDPVGTHNSNFLGIADQFLVVNKTFSQLDFQAFPDPNLQPGNVQITALTSTTIHNDGYILSSSVDQLTNLVNASPLGSESGMPSATRKSSVPGNSTTPLDLDLSSYGSLSIILSDDSLEPRRSFHQAHKTITELNLSKNMTGGSLFEVAARMIKIGKSQKTEVDEEDEAKHLLKKILKDSGSPAKQIIPLMNKLARMITSNPSFLKN